MRREPETCSRRLDASISRRLEDKERELVRERERLAEATGALFANYVPACLEALAPVAGAAVSAAS